MEEPIAAGKSSFDLVDRQEVFRLLDLEPGAVLLDMGCGVGHYSLAAASYIGEDGMIHAVDLWKDGVAALDEQVAARGLNQIDPLVVDVSKHIPLEHASVDICLMATVLHDFIEDGTDAGAMAEVTRLLKPEGALVVVEFKKIPGPPGPPLAVRLSESELDDYLSDFGFIRHVAADAGPDLYVRRYGRKR
jgi:ubiquinone/menaquinone biosynthesis C-methylase UbiE